MRPVSIVSIGQVPVQKKYELSLRALGAAVTRQAMANAGVDKVDALFVGNMLSDELQGQKHVAALIADEAELYGIEALEIQAATATGAAALRMAYLAVASEQADLAIAVGVEKMRDGGGPTAVLAKALDAHYEVGAGATLISKNADLMRLYRQQYDVPEDGFVNFAVNAHQNSRHNPNALYRQRVTARAVKHSRIVHDPLRLMDCSPICEGAAAVLLAPREEARAYTSQPVHILGSSVATDRFRVADRANPLSLEAARLSVQKAFRMANVNREDVSLFEVHDAFSIMACLLLEAVGFAQPGEGWRLAAEKEIGLKGQIPIATMGGLKARGHPIGATALYQTCEIVLQLRGEAGKNQVRDAQIGLLQSVGGAAATIITHIFGV